MVRAAARLDEVPLDVALETRSTVLWSEESEIPVRRSPDSTLDGKASGQFVLDQTPRRSPHAGMSTFEEASSLNGFR